MLELVGVVRELVLASGHGVAHRVWEVLVVRVRRLRVRVRMLGITSVENWRV